MRMMNEHAGTDICQGSYNYIKRIFENTYNVHCKLYYALEYFN